MIRDHILVRAALAHLQNLDARMSSTDARDTDAGLIRSTDEAQGTSAGQAAMTALRAPLLAIHAGYRY